MAYSGRRDKRPPGAVSLPGLARPSLGTPGRGTAAEVTAKISYTPPESVVASSVDVSESSSAGLRHLTLSRPRIRDRAPSKRVRLDSASASRAPPQLDDPPSAPSAAPPVSDFPPEAPSEPPPDLPPSLPPDLPPTPPPDLDLPLPESSHISPALPQSMPPQLPSDVPPPPLIESESSSAAQSPSLDILTTSAITGDVASPLVDQYKIGTSSPGSYPSSGLKPLEKYRKSKASGGRRTLTSLSGLSRSGVKSSPSTARRLGGLTTKKQELELCSSKLESQPKAKTTLSSDSAHEIADHDVPKGTDINNPPALPAAIPPLLEKEQQLNLAVDEKSKQLEISESRMLAPTNSGNVQIDSVGAKPSLPNSVFRSPDIVPVAQPSVQNQFITRDQVGMGSSPLSTGFKSRFPRLDDATKQGETSSPSPIRNVETANDIKLDLSDNLISKSQDSSSKDQANEKDVTLTSSSIQLDSGSKTKETASTSTSGENNTVHLRNIRTMSLSRMADHRTRISFPKMKSATDVRDKKLPTKKRFSMASLSALSPSLTGQTSVQSLPDTEPHHQLRIPAVSKPPPLDPSAPTKSRSLDRRFALTHSADVGNNSNIVPGDLSSSTDRHSEDTQQHLPELPSGPPPDIPEMPVSTFSTEVPPELPPDLPPNLSPELPPDLPPELPSELPPDLPPELPPELPPGLPPELPELLSDPSQLAPPRISMLQAQGLETEPLLECNKLMLDNDHVEGVTELKSVKVEKQSWTRSLEALKSNPISLSSVTDQQTTETNLRDDVSGTVEELGANGIGSHEALTDSFDYSFLMNSKENKASSRMSASSGDSDLLTAVFSALKSSAHNPHEKAHQDDNKASNPPVAVSKFVDHIEEQRDKWQTDPSVGDKTQLKDYDTEKQDPQTNDYRADDVKLLEKTSAKIYAASVRRKNLEANLTDKLAGNLAVLQQMQEEQDSRIGGNLMAIEEERRLAEELLQRKSEDELGVVSSGSEDGTSDMKSQLEQETVREGSCGDSDLWKGNIVCPPALYSGDLTSEDGLNAQELEKAGDSSLLSLNQEDKGDISGDVAEKLLSGSKEKAIELWTATEVTDWLRDVGLGHYARNFLDHQINGKKLLEIDFLLLDEMDIISSDEREEILAKIYNLSVGNESDADSLLEDSLHAANENGREKVQAQAPIEALKYPHGWNSDTDLRALEEKDHFAPISWKGKTVTKDIVSDEKSMNVGAHSPVDYSANVLKSRSTEPVLSTSAHSRKETVWKASTSSLNNDSSFSSAKRLPSNFGVAESCPAIRQAVDQEQLGVIRVWLLSLKTGLEYKALRVSTRMSALDIVKHLLEKLEMVDDPLRFYLVEVSSKQGVGDRELANFECPLQVQSQWKSPNKFELKIRPSGIIKVKTNVPRYKSEEKAIAISSLTSCQEVVQLTLRKFNIRDIPDKYCLVECSTTSPEKRVLGDGEYPLMVQSTWVDKKYFCLQVAAPQSRSSGGSGSIFQSPNRMSLSDLPSLPSSGYSRARLSDDIETVRAENASLWVELESLRPKAARVESLEQTVATLQSAYECLQESAAQREKHEQAMKARLQQEVVELRAAQTDSMGSDSIQLIRDLKASVSSLEDSLQMKAERVQQLEAENATLHQQLLTSSNTSQPELLAQQDRQIECLQENVRSQDIKIRELQIENAEIKSNQTQNVTNHDHSKSRDLEVTLSKKDNIIAALHAENERLQLNVQDQDNVIRDHQSTVTHLQSQLSSGRCSLFSLASMQPVSLVAAELTGLSKQESGLSIADGGSSLSGHQGPGAYIRHIKKGTPAYRVKKLAVGDRILEINGRDLSCYAAADINTILENAGNCVKLTVARGSDHIADGGLNETEILSLKLRSDALSSQLEAKNVELDQMRQDYSRLKAKTGKTANKSHTGEMEAFQQTIKTLREQLAESEQSRKELRHTLDELKISSTSAHQQDRELQEGLQQNIYDLQIRLQQAEEYKSQLEDIVREQESNIASLQKAVNEKEDALAFAETEREHAVKLLGERTQDKSTEDVVSVSDYDSAAKEELLQMLQEKEVEQRRQKSYMDQLLSLVIEHAPSILGKLHAYEEASLKSEEWC